MTEQSLAQLSNLLFVVAIVVYVLAMIGFAADLARSAQRRSDAKLDAKLGAEQAMASGARDRALVGAGAPADPYAAVADGAVSSPQRPAVAPAVVPEEPAPISRAGSFAMTMMTGGAAVHLVGVLFRGLATHRVPWSNMYEFAMTGSAVVIAAFLVILARRRDLRVLGTFLVVPMLILMLIAQRMWYVPAAALPPSLQNSHWLVIHVSVAIISTALFTIGAVVSGLQLLRARIEKQGIPAEPGRIAGILLRLPTAKDLEALAFRIHAVGFVLWTFTLIFGAIWASTAWGRYWGWDPKEVWTFVIWVVYAAYLHARATAGFRGTRSAWFALVGFACVIFNFTIVNTVINGLHSYSGLTG